MKSERGMGNGKTMKRESLKGVRGYGASKRQDARCKMEKAGREARDLSRKRLIFVYGSMATCYMAVAAAPVHTCTVHLKACGLRRAQKSARVGAWAHRGKGTADGGWDEDGGAVDTTAPVRSSHLSLSYLVPRTSHSFRRGRRGLSSVARVHGSLVPQDPHLHS